MSRSRCLALAVIASMGLVSPSLGDEFDRIEGETLGKLPKSKDAVAHPILTVREVEALPNVLRDSRSSLLIVATDQGNLARLLVSPGFYKAPGEKREPLPVLVLERFDTFEAGSLTTRLARGKDLFLFDGFQIDLDTGQIVPEGQGGDLQFLGGAKEGPRLKTLGTAKLFTLNALPAGAVASGSRPSIGRSVAPGDFAGRYRLFANGQWSGTLDLKVDGEGKVSGKFRSDLNGAVYPVSGKIAPDLPQKILFTIRFPRTEQDYEGLIWSEGKGAMAGTLMMLERSYGFFAVREGGRFAPEGDDVGTISKNGQPAGRKTVTFRKGQYTLEGQPKTDQELIDSLKRAVAADSATWVLLQVGGDETFDAINHAFEALGATGVAAVRLAPDPER